MSVRGQLKLARWALFAACVAGILAAARLAEPAIAWACAFVLLGGLRPALRRVNRLIAQRAFARGRVYAHSASALEQLRLHEATILGHQRRYADAVRLYESIDRRKLNRVLVPWLLNNLAMALARLGEGARAVTVARESIDASGVSGDRPGLNDDLRACQLGTLGIALVVAGQPSEALDPLEQALTRGGNPRQQATRACYLGDALRALGREDEARAAWRRAADAAPDDELGVRAREKLDHAAPPYR